MLESHMASQPALAAAVASLVCRAHLCAMSESMNRAIEQCPKPNPCVGDVRESVSIGRSGQKVLGAKVVSLVQYRMYRCHLQRWDLTMLPYGHGYATVPICSNSLS